MDEFEKALRTIYWAKQQITSLEQDIQDAYTVLGDKPVGQYAGNKFILKVSPNKRFDAATANRNLTDEELAKIVLPTPNAALAKAFLSPDRYKAAQKDYGIKREVVPVTDEEDY